MLYRDATIMDTTIGKDMDKTNGKMGLVFMKVCCMCELLFSLGIPKEKAIFPLVYLTHKGKHSFRGFTLSHFHGPVNAVYPAKF